MKREYCLEERGCFVFVNLAVVLIMVTENAIEKTVARFHLPLSIVLAHPVDPRATRAK